MTKPIAAYMRVSSKMQADANGVESQRYEIERWLDYQGIDRDTVRWYVDEAQTGRDMDRPAFREMTAAIEAGEHDTVVAWDISRISRGFNAEAIEWMERLEERGVRLNLLQMGVDTSTAYGKFFFRFLWLQSCLFSDLKSDEWKRTLAKRKAEGKPIGGQIAHADRAWEQDEILKLHAKNPDMTVRQIERAIRKKHGKGPSVTKVWRVLNEKSVVGAE